MSEELYRVHVVVDTEYGERLRELPVDEPVWVVDSACNRSVVQALWQERTGVTSFKCDPSGTPEDWLLSNLSTVDLHHGECSQGAPYAVLNVIGAEWSEAIQEELDRFGLSRVEATAEGFMALKVAGEG